MNSTVHRLTFSCYPFTPSDLDALLWSATHHRPAHDAIVQAENRATDDPSRRPKANAYIADCLANIRRKMAAEAERATWTEQAEVIAFGFEMQDRIRHEAELRRVAQDRSEAQSPASGAGNAAGGEVAAVPVPEVRRGKKEKAAVTDGLFAGVK